MDPPPSREGRCTYASAHVSRMRVKLEPGVDNPSPPNARGMGVARITRVCVYRVYEALVNLDFYARTIFAHALG